MDTAGGASITPAITGDCFASSLAEVVMFQGPVFIPLVFIFLFLP